MSCESCCGYEAVTVVKRALASLMCYLKAQFLWAGALPVVLIWEHMFEVWGEGQRRRDASLFHGLLWLATPRLRGRAEVKRVGLGEEAWLVRETRVGWPSGWAPPCTRTRTHPSPTVSHALRQTSPWLFTASALIWPVTVLTARVEKADCSCPGIRALRILHRYGAQRLVKNLGLDIVVNRSIFLLTSGDLAYTEVRPTGKWLRKT